MRFLVPDRSALPADAVDRAYLTGLDEIPWRSRTQWTDEGLAIRRMADDSGNFHIPWNVPGFGELTLQTACLMEREAPYHLAVELARGTLNRIRNQFAAWQAAGVPVPDRPAQLTAALKLLAQAVTAQHDPALANMLARQSLGVSLELIQLVSRTYAENALAQRRRQQSRISCAYCVNLGSVALGETVGRYVVGTFNTTLVPLAWSDIEPLEGKRDWRLADKQIEWSRANNLKTITGPLLSLDQLSLPGWLFLYEGDKDAIVSYVEDYLRTAVNRYKGRVNLWQVAGRMNVHDALDLSEEDRLRLAAFAIETVRSLDARVPITLTIDQPWAEFMRGQDCDFSPLHFADALVRADLGLSGIGLEINVGYSSDSTQMRDLLDFSRMIDRWSSLGLPLLVFLTAPGSTEADPKARSKVSVIPAAEATSMPQAQARWIDQLVPLLLAKPAVQGIIWNQLLDTAPHELPNSGLFDSSNHPKPAANSLREIRHKFLG